MATNESRPLNKQSGEGQGWGSVFGFPRRSGDLEINPRPPSPDCLPVYPGLASPSYNTSRMVGTELERTGWAELVCPHAGRWGLPEIDLEDTGDRPCVLTRTAVIEAGLRF